MQKLLSRSHKKRRERRLPQSLPRWLDAQVCKVVIIRYPRWTFEATAGLHGFWMMKVATLIAMVMASCQGLSLTIGQARYRSSQSDMRRLHIRCILVAIRCQHLGLQLRYHHLDLQLHYHHLDLLVAVTTTAVRHMVLVIKGTLLRPLLITALTIEVIMSPCMHLCLHMELVLHLRMRLAMRMHMRLHLHLRMLLRMPPPPTHRHQDMRMRMYRCMPTPRLCHLLDTARGDKTAGLL